MDFNFEQKATKSRLHEFANQLLKIQNNIGFKISSRGWCYQLEQERIINKDQFDKVENMINRCRKRGILPIDFVAEEEARKFSGVEVPKDSTPVEYFGELLESSLSAGDYYTPNWWEGEDVYIQMVVEKIDLKTLFEPVCREYHIPIATSKGWSSIIQRAEYAKRFEEAEQKGMACLLLYCGDHDPDGLRISDFLKSNLADLKNVVWSDGTRGYDPANLVIDRFGLNYDFIQKHQLTWIDNLITGRGLNLADPEHRNNKLDYVQGYLKKIGERKCEANAIVPMPQIARDMVRKVIESYLGTDAKIRFKVKREAAQEEIENFLEENNYDTMIKSIIRHSTST